MVIAFREVNLQTGVSGRQGKQPPQRPPLKHQVSRVKISRNPRQIILGPRL